MAVVVVVGIAEYSRVNGLVCELPIERVDLRRQLPRKVSKPLINESLDPHSVIVCFY